ncbi:PHP domain-containing protein [Microcella sp.]|uniref:PHP domain-containing protein n=1 Tax=Microcella sp. TaxID=1913979 RepID=UPI0025607EA2|nr:PHP domain-containing protein [Microcella sp.]MBX9472842.1 PHP domain-containing protein [Microcella sp.]
MPRGPIDLHTHSSVSDGTETPTQLIRAALAAGLDTIAITDHDSTAGWDEALTAAEGTGLQVIRGIELSTRHEWRSVHLLGYLFDPNDAELVAETGRTRDDRLGRAERMVTRLSEDFDITWADVLAQSGGVTIGRPHIADALVARGIVPNRSAAFESILHFTGGYYLPHEAPTVLDGVRMIAAAGGAPVLAHPATRGREAVVDERSLARLVEAGLVGLEVGHRENTPEGRERLLELAEQFDLVTTGSSDYHGEGKPNRLAENTTTPEALERIIAATSGVPAARA